MSCSIQTAVQCHPIRKACFRKAGTQTLRVRRSGAGVTDDIPMVMGPCGELTQGGEVFEVAFIRYEVGDGDDGRRYGARLRDYPKEDVIDPGRAGVDLEMWGASREQAAHELTRDHDTWTGFEKLQLELPLHAPLSGTRARQETGEPMYERDGLRVAQRFERCAGLDIEGVDEQVRSGVLAQGVRKPSGSDGMQVRSGELLGHAPVVKVPTGAVVRSRRLEDVDRLGHSWRHECSGSSSKPPPWVASVLEAERCALRGRRGSSS